MEEFFTRESANEGFRLPLSLPDGSPSKHWFHLLGMDSDAFRIAETQAKRAAFELAQIEDEAERTEAMYAKELECIAALISSWSFEQECTLENKVRFLREAPQIAKMVNKVAAMRGLLVKKKSPSSTSGQKVK